MLYRDYTKKTFLILMIILIPIVVMILYTSKNTSIEINKKISNNYLSYFKDGYTILYIGYTGCVNVCTPRLFEISTLQRALLDEDINISYQFLDLRLLGKSVSEDFLKAFDANIDVLDMPNRLKGELMRELNFYSARSLYDSNEFEHSSYLYLIEKKDNLLIHLSTIMQYPFDNENTIAFIKNKVNDE